MVSLRSWTIIHRWSSLLCTLFLLIICITGLPLIFSDEIQQWQDGYAEVSNSKVVTAQDLDGMVNTTKQMFPREIFRWVVFSDQGHVLVTMAPSLAASPMLNHWVRFGQSKADILENSLSNKKQQSSFMKIILHLHTDLFGGLLGELFLGFMGLLFLVAIISGGVLYRPFMRKLDFGAVRKNKGRRIRWLDLHNLLGVATITWAVIVGTTGVINELSTPLFSLWSKTEVSSLLEPYKQKPLPSKTVSVGKVYETIQSAMPDKAIFSIVFPDPVTTSAHHYMVWVKGNTPLTSRLFTPLLVDAETGLIAERANLPWYLKTLELSRPLHFGDYAGTPLKFLWLLFDLVTIVVLLSGLYLWLEKRVSNN